MKMCPHEHYDPRCTGRAAAAAAEGAAPVGLSCPLRGLCAAGNRFRAAPGPIPRAAGGVEIAEREDRRLKRLLDDAELPEGKTLATLELERYPSPMRAQIKELCTGRFTDEDDPLNIYLAGKPGTGKSHIGAAIGRGCVEQGIPVLYTPVSALVESLLKAKRDLHLADELKRLDRFDCLICDDIGYVKQDSAQMEVLFSLIAERYERKSLVITSNLRFSEWDQIFKDPMMTAAAVDRVTHHSATLWFDGPSYRADKAEERAKAARQKSSRGDRKVKE